MHEPQRRETCWRVVEGATGRLVVCAIYETPSAGLEVRVGYALPDRPVRSERLRDLESARVRASQWLDAFRAAGFIDSLRMA